MKHQQNFGQTFWVQSLFFSTAATPALRRLQDLGDTVTSVNSSRCFMQGPAGSQEWRRQRAKRPRNAGSPFYVSRALALSRSHPLALSPSRALAPSPALHLLTSPLFPPHSPPRLSPPLIARSPLTPPTPLSPSQHPPSPSLTRPFRLSPSSPRSYSLPFPGSLSDTMR